MAGRLPQPSAWADHWALDPDVCFLNHGSFGATPRVLDLRAHARARDTALSSALCGLSFETATTRGR
jgi:hypothetical protein